MALQADLPLWRDRYYRKQAASRGTGCHEAACSESRLAPRRTWCLSNKTKEEGQPSGRPRQPGSLLLPARFIKQSSYHCIETALSDPLKEDDTCVPLRSSWLLHPYSRSSPLLCQISLFPHLLWYETKLNFL